VRSEPGGSLGGEAIELLLQLLELPNPGLSAAMAQDLHREGAAALLSAKLLRPDGHELAVVLADSDDQAPRAVTWDPETCAYRVFADKEGWVVVPEDHLARYVADIPAIFMMLTARLQRLPGAAVREGAPGALWDLGGRRIPGRARLAPVWFARRLSHPGVWPRVKDAIRARPPEHQRIILTSTPAEQLPEPGLPRHVVLSLHDLLVGQADLRIAMESLAARLDDPPAGTGGTALEVIGDGREVRLHGELFRFPKGETQRRVIVKLYERYLAGEVRVLSSQIVADLDLDPSTRMRDLFKRSPAWGRLLAEKDSMLGFCLAASDLGAP